MQKVTDEAISELVTVVGDMLADHGLKVATAESCTGGWIAKVLTDRPGSSVYMDSGLVTYTNQSKQTLLGVSAMSLERYGAVSEPVAREMVLGALASSAGNVALSVTGVAGPGGGSDEKPVGMVWFAWGRRGDQPVATCQRFTGDREMIRRQAVVFALEGLHRLVMEPAWKPSAC